MSPTITRTVRRGVTMLLAAAAAAALGGCAASAGNGVTEINFFQFKGEALEDFNEIIADFEAENPDIRIVQNQVADADTLIRTLLVKDRVPDLITLNANGNFGRLAQAGVFYDFTEEPVLQTINPAVQEILAGLGNAPGEVNGLGYVNNANGIIYNKDIFEQQGLEEPETWDELIAVCDALVAAGITPFYGTLGDQWTGLPSFNALGAYPAQQDDFFPQLNEEGADIGPDSAVSFTKDFQQVLERQAQLFSYMQDGYRGATYDDGNAAFADGASAMMLQGIWATGQISANNPDIRMGIFPYPDDDPDSRLLVSGVDVVFTMGKDNPKADAALRFIDYVFSPEVITQFGISQNLIPSVTDAELSDSDVIQAVAPYFENGQITGFIDHQFPPSVPLAATDQQFLFDGDADQALAALDSEWRKVAARTIPVTTGDGE